MREFKWFHFGFAAWGVSDLMPNPRTFSERALEFGLPPLPTEVGGDWRVGEPIVVEDDDRKFVVASNGIAGNPIFAYPVTV